MEEKSTHTKRIILRLLIKVSSEIHRDLDGEIEFADKDLNTYLIFLRINEIYDSIIYLLRSEHVIVANALIRPLSEAYILMKASIEDKSFYKKYFKTASKEKIKWLNKIMHNYQDKALGQPSEYYSTIKKSVENKIENMEEELPNALGLFKNHGELDMYMQMYSVGSLYLHTNLQSLQVYLDEDRNIVPHAKRDYVGRYVHTGYSAVTILLHSYRLLCTMLKKDKNIAEKLASDINKHVKRHQHKF